MSSYDELRTQLGLKPAKSTSPYKNGSSSNSNTFSSSVDDKRRKEEEERRRKEEAERKRKDQQRDAKLKAIEDLAHGEKTTQTQTNKPSYSDWYNKEGRQDVLKNNPTFGTPASKRDMLNINKQKTIQKHSEFASYLDEDFYQANESSKAIGKKLTPEDVIPEYDNDVDSKLSKIKESIKPGAESLGYSIKEGAMEREVMNLLSKESYRQMMGKPNNVAKINKFIEDNPELFASSEDNKAYKRWARGATDVALQQVQSLKSALPEIATYTGVGGAIGGALSTPTLGATAPITTTTGALLGFKYGMKAGSAQHMYQVEAGLSYNDMIAEGIPHEIAKPIAMGVGAVNGLIETVQLGRTIEHIPGLDEVIQKVKKEGLQASMDSIKKLGLTYAGDLGKNIAEELAQENVGMLGQEIAQVYNSEQDPTLYGGFKNYAEKIGTPEWRNIMRDVAVGTAESMWLLPWASGASGVAVNTGIRTLETKINNTKKDNLLYTQLPDLIKNAEADILNDDEAIKQFNAINISFDEALNKEAVSNKDKEQINKLKDELEGTLTKLEYEAKEIDNEIEYQPSNISDVEAMFMENDFEINDIELYNSGVNEFTIENYKNANEYGILNTIKEGIASGVNKVTIADKILKNLPKKERSTLNAMTMVNEVEKLMTEIKSQSIMNGFYNIAMAKEVLSNNLPTKEVKEVKDELIEGTQTEDDIVTNAIEPIKEESSVAIPQEPTDNIQSEITTEDSVEIKFSPSSIVDVPVNIIQVDPERFQFRYDRGNESGATRKLVGANWNDTLAGNVLLWEDEYGDVYVVNGHHRVDLARQSDVETLRADILSAKEGITAEVARATGALLNIAEGNATAIDIGKYIKDTDTTLQEMEKFGVPPRSKVAKDGYSLSQLEDWLFTQVATRAFPIERGIIIGREFGDNKAAQRQIVRELGKMESKGKTVTNEVLNEMIAAVKGTAQVSFTEQTLLGEEFFTKDLAVERAEVVTYVKGQLKDRVSVLKNVTKEKNANLLEELGNSIAIDDNVKEMTAAEQALYILDKTLNYAGTKTNELFNKYAEEYANATPAERAKIKKRALNEFIKLMEGGNLLNAKANKETKRRSIKSSIKENTTDGEGRQESMVGDGEILENQVDLFGNEVVNQLKAVESIKVIVNKGTELWTKRDIMPIIDAMKKNVFFNGIEVEFSGKASTQYWDRRMLDEAGYKQAKEGFYTIAGSYKPGGWNNALVRKGNNIGTFNTSARITINNGATKDTILHEAIHHIKRRIDEINPELGVLIKAWEDDIRNEAASKNILLPDGDELVVHALLHGEFGYAKDDPIGNLVAVDNDIVDQMVSIIGDEVLELAMGKDQAIDKDQRTLKTQYYKDYADRIFMQNNFMQDLEAAQENRKTDIRRELANARAIQYHHPSNETYVIVSPSTKGHKYQVTYFDNMGAFMDAQVDAIDDVADMLVTEQYYYKSDEIHYQLKQFTRGVADELYGIAISRGYRTDNNSTTNRERISFQLNDTQIIEAYHDAQIGNFSAQDFDELILNNSEVEDRVKKTLVERIVKAVDNGYDVPNSEVKVNQYLNRFYNVGIQGKDSPYVIRYDNGKLKLGQRSIDSKGEVVFTRADTFNNLEDALKTYKEYMTWGQPETESDLKHYLRGVVKSDFRYMVDMLRDSKAISDKAARDKILNDLYEQYMDFRDNTETYRHKGLNYNFDMKPHYAISYQLKKGIINEEDSQYWNFPKHRGELTLDKVERYLKDSSSYRSFNRIVAEFESPEKLQERLFWHGTGGYINRRLKAGFRVPEEQRGGGYGEIQHTISLSKSKKVASNFSNNSRTVSIYPVVVQDGAKIIDRPDISDAIELEDELLDLWKDKVDAVAIGDWDKESSEKELVILNPRVISNVGKAEHHQVYGIGGKVQEPTIEEITTMWEESKKAIEEYKASQTKINLQLKAATDTQEFKNWFKDSKVVDEEGNPLVVYHGTKKGGFEQFVSRRTDTQGFYFSKDAEYTNAFRGIKDDGNYYPSTLEGIEEGYYNPQLYEVFLSVQNPLILKNELQDVIEDIGYWEDVYNPVKERGYDAVMLEDMSQIFVFNPTQIKSIYNNGMFNEYDPNINYQLKSASDGIEQYSLDTDVKTFNNFVTEGETVTVEYIKQSLDNGIAILNVDKEVDENIYDLVVRDGVLGGYDYIKVADAEPKIIPLEDIEKIIQKEQFQLKEVPETNGNLLAVHNLSEEKLKNVIKLGGFPMPSIAVVKTDYTHDAFGEISVLFNRNTIDPQSNRFNKIYGGDAYTPTFPRVEYKISEKVAEQIRKLVNKSTDNTEYRRIFTSTYDNDNMNDKVNRSGSFAEAYNNDSLLMLTYLNEKGIPFEPVIKSKNYGWDLDLLEILANEFKDVVVGRYITTQQADVIAPRLRELINGYYGAELYAEPLGFGQVDRITDVIWEYSKDNVRTEIDRWDTDKKLKEIVDQEDFNKWLNEISTGIIEKEGFRNNKDLFTPSGNRRSWDALHDEVTLDKVVKAMRGQDDIASEGFSGIGKFIAASSKMYKSIEQMKQDSDRLVSMNEESYSEIKKEYSDRLLAIADKIKSTKSSNSFMALDRATEAIIDAIQNAKTRIGILKILQEYNDVNVTDSALDEIMQLSQDASNMPTEYFEAKPKRAVYINEIAAVIAPNTLSPGTEQMLRDNGINLIEKYSSDEDRQVAIDRVLRQNDVSFQLKEADTNTEQFKKWFRDSKVVDDEGKPLRVYHGTPNNFSAFDNEQIGNRTGNLGFYGKGLYFTSHEFTANLYGENIMPVYLSISNPFVIDNYTDVDMLAELAETNAFHETANNFYNIEETLAGNEETFTNNLIKQGYDGIIVNKRLGVHDLDKAEIVVFNPTQIKSVYNQGTWDVNNPNIYYQLKEEPDMEERSWGQTVRDSSIVSEELKDLLTNNKFMYEVKHNQNTILAAAELIDKKGEEWVEARVLSDLDDDAILFAASQILTFKYMEQGETDRAMRIVEKSAEKATSAGQAIQILSVWGRQTPEGMLRSVTNIYKKAMTDKDRKNILDKTNKLKDEFNRLNVEGINSIDLVGAIRSLDEQSSQERLKRQLASTEQGRNMVEKYGIESILDKADNIAPDDMSKIESFLEKTPIDSDMTDVIIKTIKDHYVEGKGNLKDKLTNLGLNDFEAEILNMYVKNQMRDYAKDQKMSLIGDLPRQKYERKTIDQQILDMISEGKVDENLLKNLVGEKEGLPVLSRDLVDYIYTQGQYINSLEPGRQKDVETGKLIKEVMDHVPVSRWHKIALIQTMAQLLNMKTIIRNLIGNAMFETVDTFTINTLGSSIDSLISKYGGTKRTTLFRPVQAAKAQVLGYKEGWRLGLEDALLGINTSDTKSQYDFKQTRTFNHGVLAKLETAMNISMRATDRAAFTASFIDSLEEQMQIAGVDTPTDAMVENATQLGLYRTFADDTKISKLFSTLKGALNLGQGFGLGDLIMKYPKTPANIMGRAIDYSPIGLLLTMMHLKQSTSTDQYVRQRMAVEGVSRALMGTGLITIGAILAQMGILTGGNPDDDEDIYELEKQYGLRDYSVNVSAINRYLMSLGKDTKAGELRKGDTIASYDWMQPISMSLAVGTDAILGKGEDLDALTRIVNAANAGVDTLLDQPLLTGLSNLFRYGDLKDGFVQTIKQAPASFTPTLFSQVAQFIDGRDTDPYSFYGTGQQSWNLVQNRIPGLRGNIPSRYSVLGDERRYQPEDRNLVLKAINTFLNPAITNTYMPNEEAEFIFDLYEASGDPDIVPRKPQKSYTFNGEKVTPTPEEWQEWSKWLGETTRKELDRAINGYMRGWSAEEQADEIKWIIKDTRNRLKDKIEEEQVK